MALAFGMTVEQYWHDDPWLYAAYHEAYRQGVEQAHAQAWLNGLYTYVAIGRLAPVLRAFSKARRPQDYPKAPFGSGAEESDAAGEAGRAHRQVDFIARLRAQAMRDQERREGAADG